MKNAAKLFWSVKLTIVQKAQKDRQIYKTVSNEARVDQRVD